LSVLFDDHQHVRRENVRLIRQNQRENVAGFGVLFYVEKRLFGNDVQRLGAIGQNVPNVLDAFALEEFPMRDRPRERDTLIAADLLGDVGQQPSVFRHPVGHRIMVAGSHTDDAVFVPDLLEVVEEIVPAVGNGKREDMLAVNHTVRLAKIDQRFRLVERVRPVTGAGQIVRHSEKSFGIEGDALGDGQVLLADNGEKRVDFHVAHFVELFDGRFFLRERGREAD